MSAAQRLLETALAAGIVVLLVELLRRRRLRERFAVIWVLVAVGVVVAVLFPGLTGWLSARLGFALEANFLLVLLGMVLLFVSLQLSLEVVKMQGQVQRLAEDLALLRMEAESARGSAPTAAASDSAPPQSTRGSDLTDQ